MAAPATSTPLHTLLVDRIRAIGPITFAEYMQACLYHPQFGYYSGTSDRRRTDYYTSVDASPIFGRLLARQIHEMWMLLGKPAEFLVIEAGAGIGALARQILDCAVTQWPEMYRSLRYIAVEISATRRQAHAEALAIHISAGRATSSAELPATIPIGCILSNELLDALPVHRVVMNPGELKEIFVDVDAGVLVERLLPPSTREIPEFFVRQGIALHEGQHAEAGIAACRWIAGVGSRLGRGFVLTIDYGREARELYDDRHMRGTILAYSHHRASEDFYRAPGEQDLTAHVNFTALDLWGCDAGLERAGLATQSSFLLALARRSNFADLLLDKSGAADQVRARLQFNQLIHPEGMGETFQVMLQKKGIVQAQLSGFDPL